LCPESLTNVGVISLAVEFGIGQHQSDASLLGSGFDHRGQIRAVVPRAAPCGLRQQELLIQVRHHSPLQPVPPRQRLLPVMEQATHKERADRSLRQTRRVHADAGSSSACSVSAAQTTHGLADRLVDGLLVQTLQETILRREIGHTGAPQGLMQFAMFGEPHLGLPKGPVLVTHQTENSQQLRLGEMVLAETTAVARKHRLGNLQSDASEGHHLPP
jgi:hypothetical protein